MSTPRQTEKTRTVPRPRPPIDPRTEPFVGNATSDDNLIEAVEIAIWNTIGEAAHRCDIKIDDGIVTVSGKVDDIRHCADIEAAVAQLEGVRGVVNQIEPHDVHPIAPATGELWQAEGQPMISLTRFCGTDEASLSAAIRDGVARLDAMFGRHKLALPTSLFVIYRNHQHDTVTLEIGMPVGVDEATGNEFHHGTTPSGPTLSIDVAAGAGDVMHACSTLPEHARTEGHVPETSCWQRFEAPSFRPWTGHPKHTLNVCVSPA